MSFRAFAFIFALLALLPASSLAGDDARGQLTWLGDFFRQGIASVNAQYSLKTAAPGKVSEEFYKRSDYAVQFDFPGKIYTYSYIYEYRDSWSSLTNNGTTEPPKQETYFVGSKVTPWTVTGDVAIYREAYDKKVPNWFVFDDLDSLFITQCLLQNPMPAITGIFYADEFKALKRLYKEGTAAGKMNGIWSCFEFDASGNVVGISPVFLTTLNTASLTKDKGFEDYSIVVRNTAGEAIFLEILTSVETPLLMEGISIRRDKQNIRIYNFELNSLLHKFVPELIADPRDLVQAYAKSLQEESDRELLRFETTENK